MSWVAIGVTGVSLIGSGIKAAKGHNQEMRGLDIQGRNVNPGFERNQGVIQNEEVLRRRFGNYITPGTSGAIDNINSLAGTGLSLSREGARTSGDILEAATRIAYGSQLNTNNIIQQSAQGQDRALMDWIQSNQQAGQEATRSNEWDRQGYMMDRTDAANLQNAGIANQMGAVDSSLAAILQFVAANPNLFKGDTQET